MSSETSAQITFRFPVSNTSTFIVVPQVVGNRVLEPRVSDSLPPLFTPVRYPPIAPLSYLRFQSRVVL